ncbi:MAG: MFS transporter [Ruminococcaceae bacterium]|nr:MFS transporter [Oscillospiraceae bacterium]
MSRIQRNKVLAIVSSVLRTLCVLCATGTLFQTFLSSVGFSEKQIYLNATLVQAVNVGTILLFSHFADGKRPHLRSALVQIPNGLLFLAYLPFCLGQGASSFLLLTAVSLLQSVCTALNTVCEYKLPYLLYKPTDYATVQAIIGVLSAAATFGIGELLHYLEARVPYDRLMLYIFPIAALFFALAGVAALFYSVAVKECEQENEAVTRAPRISAFSIFRRPVFYLLLPANLLRGFASGVVTVLATVAISLGFGAELTTRMVSLSAVANLVGCLLFGLVSRYLSPRISILVGSLCFLSLPLCLEGSPTLFLLAYAVVYFGRSIVDVAVPSLLVCAVDADIAGPYNAWRMILHNGGTLLATAIASYLSPKMLLLLALGGSVVSGISFFAIRLLRVASPWLSRKPHLLHLHKGK